ncbi:TetR/AcrR family transcriptional regulator C-terminal domain-containing protein [Streptomyces marincola]|uniref:TetR family transcriptional regulator n=1 Tax=Streptomyces marincola TaxID=2878388 RepID=A0A1W7CZE2_9ACTN|nr:TetR/AcrR family transcriptional regulator C-terminal domain-containing protein [Streptomyces marincola]ARQ70183.1 TetR family transcriptional regulator [Streptomyces marincola]
MVDVCARRSPGRRAGLSRQAALETALALVDREGLKALSMRRLGGELGVEAMTLYHYVPSKDALLDGLVEQVVAAVAPPRLDAPWQTGVRDFAHALLDALSAHPHVLPLVVSRPAITARNVRLRESTLRSLREAGFPARRALDVLYSITSLVVGHAATTAVHDASGTEASPDLDTAQSPDLAEAIRTGPDVGADRRFDFALEAMLSGFEAARLSGR